MNDSLKTNEHKEENGWGTAVMIVLGLFFLLFMLYFVFNGSNKNNTRTDPVATPQEKDSSSESSRVTVKPEDIVQFKESSYACVTREDFQKSIQEAVAGEKTKFAALFADFTCMKIPSNQKYKVLSVDNGFLSSYVEVVNIKSDSSEGMWTTDESITRKTK